MVLQQPGTPLRDTTLPDPAPASGTLRASDEVGVAEALGVAQPRVPAVMRDIIA